jgi:hypothetical protein
LKGDSPLQKLLNLTASLLIIALLALGYFTYNHIQQLNKHYESAQTQIAILQQQEKVLQAQLKEKAITQHQHDAKSVATQFVNIYHDVSITGKERADKLQKLMAPATFKQKVDKQQKQLPAIDTVKSRLEITYITSSKIGPMEKVWIDYDHIERVSNTENYVEKMQMIVDLTHSNGKWFVSNYTLNYKQGPEGKGV